MSVSHEPWSPVRGRSTTFSHLILHGDGEAAGGGPRRGVAVLLVVLLVVLSVLLSSSAVLAQERVPSEATLAGEFAGAGTVAADGTFVYSVPIEAPASAAGIEPSLTLEYTSAGGVSMLGRGWSLGGLSQITRCSPEKGEVIANGDPLADRAFCLDAVRLKLKNPSADQHEYGAPGTHYGVERDNAVTVVAEGRCGYGPCAFYVLGADGGMVAYTQGVYPEIEAGSAGGDVESLEATAMSWSVSGIADSDNNLMRIFYHAHSGALYPARILYGENLGGGQSQATHAVEFVYNLDFASGTFERTHAHIDRRYHNGGVIDASHILLERIDTYIDVVGEDFGGARRVSSYALYYAGHGDAGEVRHTARLEQVQYCVAGGGGVAGGCLEPLVFSWNPGQGGWGHESVPVAMPMVRAALGGEYTDWNGLVNVVSYATLLALPLDATPIGWVIDIIAGIIDLGLWVLSWFDLNEQTYGGVLAVGEYVDLNADGLPDYVGDAGAQGGAGAIWFGSVDGAWSDSGLAVPARYGVFPEDTGDHAVAGNPFTRPEDRYFADVDGDGFLDMVRREGSVAGSAANWTDEVYYQLEYRLAPMGQTPSELDRRHDRYYYMKSYLGTWRLYRGDGKGGFSFATELPGPLDSHDLVPVSDELGHTPVAVAFKQPLGSLVDVNGDGRLDYVRGYCDVVRDSISSYLLTGGQGDCGIHLQRQDGTFADSGHALPQPLWGRTEFAAHESLEEESTRAHVDDAHWYKLYGYATPIEGGAVHPERVVRVMKSTLVGQLIDINGDGYPDYVQRECDIGSESCVWLGTGNEDGQGFFRAAPDFALALPPQVDGVARALFMDVNGDRYPDQVEAGDCGLRSALADDVTPEGEDPPRGWCRVFHGTGLGFVEAGRLSRDPLGEEILFQDFNGDGYLDYHKRGGCGNSADGCTFLGTGGYGEGLFVREDDFPLPVEDFENHFVELDLVPGLGSLPLVDPILNGHGRWDYRLGSFLDLDADGAVDYLASVCVSDAEPVGDQGESGTFDRVCQSDGNNALYRSGFTPARIVAIDSRRGNHRVAIDYEQLRDGNGVYRRTVDSAALPEGVGVAAVGGEVVASITTEVHNQPLDPAYAHHGRIVEQYRYEDLLFARYNGVLGFARRWHLNANNALGSVLDAYQFEQGLERSIDWGPVVGEESYAYYPLAGLSRTEVDFRGGACSGAWPQCVEWDGERFTATASRESVYEVADDEQVANPALHRVRIVHGRRHRHGEYGQRVAATGVSFLYDDHGYPVVVVDHGDLDVNGDESTVYADLHHNGVDPGEPGMRLGLSLGSRGYLGQAFAPRSPGDGVSAPLPDFSAEPASFAGMTLAGAGFTRHGESGTDYLAATTTAGVWDGGRWLTTSATEDSFGRVISATDALGVTRTTSYGRARVDVAGISVDTDVIEHTVTGEGGEDGGTVSNHYDRASGALVRRVDARGGVFDSEVDALGRTSGTYVPDPAIGSTATIGPLSTALTFWDGEIGDYTTEVRTALGHADQITSHHIARSYADALGRTYLSRTTTVDVDSEFAIGEPDDTIGLPAGRDWIEQRTEYDDNGLESRTSDPYRRGSGASLLWTETLADAYGDTWRVMAPSGVIHDIVRQRNEPEPSVHETIGEYGTVLGGPGEGGEGDARLTVSETVYDRQGRVKHHRTNPQTVATEYTWDRINRTVTTRDSAGVERIHQVDLLGRTIGTLGDGGLRARYYNAFGQLERSTQHGDIGTPDDELTTSYHYDGLGRLIEVRDAPADADSERTTRYHYDGIDPDTGEADPANPHALGLLTTIVHPDGDRDTFLYDRLGRVVEKRRHIAVLDETFVSRTGYGLSGEVQSHTYPDGYHVSYHYDPHHRLAAVRGREPGQAEKALLHSPVYDELDRLVEARLGNGTRVRYEYDAYGRPVASVHDSGAGEVLFAERLAYNGIEQLTAADETLAGVDPVIVNVPPETRPIQNRGLAYTYDEFNRLTATCLSANLLGGDPGACPGELEQRAYTYQQGGALRSLLMSQNGQPARQKEWRYHDDDPHRLETLIDLGHDGEMDVLKYRYDPRGNVREILRDGHSERQMVFDRHNRLRQVTSPGSSPGTTQLSTFTYDHDLQRISRTDADGTATFYISHNYEVTRTINGVMLRTRYIGDGGALKMSFSDITGESESTPYLYPGAGYPDRGYRYFFSDQRGTTRLVTDGLGRVRARMSPGPYGEHYQLQGQNNFRPGFIGQERDRKTGLDYLNARYYDPESHQFLSTDPAGEFDNPYLYSPANPIAYADPSGRITIGKLIRKFSTALSAGQVTAILGLGRTSQLSDTAFSMVQFLMHHNGISNLRFLDLRAIRNGEYRVVRPGATGYTTSSYSRIADAMRNAGLTEDANDRILLLMQHNPGPRGIQFMEEGSSYSIKEVYERLVGGSFNRAVKCIIDLGCGQGASGHAQQLANSLGRSVYASPFDVSTPFARLTARIDNGYLAEILITGMENTNLATARAAYQTVIRSAGQQKFIAVGTRRQRLNLFFAFFDADGVNVSYRNQGEFQLMKFYSNSGGHWVKTIIGRRSLHPDTGEYFSALRNAGSPSDLLTYASPPLSNATTDELYRLLESNLPNSVSSIIGVFESNPAKWEELWIKFRPQ